MKTYIIFSLSIIFTVFTSLLISRPIELEETDEAIITYLKNVSFSEDGTKFLINDHSTGDIKVYETSTGKLLEHLPLPLYFTDTVVNHLRNLYEYDTLTYYVEKKMVLFTIPELGVKVDYNYDKQSISQYFGNMITHSEFIGNDEIISIANVVLPSVRFSDVQQRFVWDALPETIVFKYSLKMKDYTINLIEPDKYMDTNFQKRRYPYPDMILPININDFYISFRSEIDDETNADFVELHDLMRFQSGNLTPASTLPDELVETRLFYSLCNSIFILALNNNLYNVYKALPFVYENNEKLFSLKPEELYEVDQSFLSGKSKGNLSAFVNKLGYHVEGFTLSGESMFIHIAHTENFPIDTLRKKSKIQKYDYQGKLIDEIVYPDTTYSNKILNITYNPAEGELYAFIYDKENEIWKYETVNFDN